MYSNYRPRKMKLPKIYKHKIKIKKKKNAIQKFKLPK